MCNQNLGTEDLPTIVTELPDTNNWSTEVLHTSLSAFATPHTQLIHTFEKLYL
jgi:hypothetical protein